MTLNKKIGFTLIELIVIVSIIGLLATLSVVSFTVSRSKSRDTVRLSDIQQMSVALEYYYDDHKMTYPRCSTCDYSDDWQTCLGEALKPYMKELPRDPLKLSDSGYCYSAYNSSDHGNQTVVDLNFFTENKDNNVEKAVPHITEGSPYYHYRLPIKLPDGSSDHQRQ